MWGKLMNPVNITGIFNHQGIRVWDARRVFSGQRHKAEKASRFLQKAKRMCPTDTSIDDLLAKAGDLKHLRKCRGSLCCSPFRFALKATKEKHGFSPPPTPKQKKEALRPPKGKKSRTHKALTKFPQAASGGGASPPASGKSAGASAAASPSASATASEGPRHRGQAAGNVRTTKAQRGQHG